MSLYVFFVAAAASAAAAFVAADTASFAAEVINSFSSSSSSAAFLSSLVWQRAYSCRLDDCSNGHLYVMALCWIIDVIRGDWWNNKWRGRDRRDTIHFSRASIAAITWLNKPVWLRTSFIWRIATSILFSTSSSFFSSHWLLITASFQCNWIIIDSCRGGVRLVLI